MDRYPGLRSVVFLGGLAFLAFFGYLTYSTVKDVFLWRKLDDEGVTAQAQVTEKFTESGINGGNKVTYQFTANGQSYTNTVKLGLPDYEAVAVGQRVSVLYAASDPSSNDAATGRPKNVTGSILFLAVFGLIGAVLVTVSIPLKDS